MDVDLVINNFSPQFDEAAYLQHEIFLTGITLGVGLALGVVYNIGEGRLTLTGLSEAYSI